MTNFPNEIDTDLELPPVYDNIVEIGEVAVNAIRSAMFAVEETLGINPQGSMTSVATRLDVSLEANGTLKPSAITGLGLVVLPITNDQVSVTAGIEESKLSLTYSTQFLHDLFSDLNTAVNVLENFKSVTGIKVEPHVAGSAFRHKLSHVDVDSGVLNRVNITAGSLVARNLTNSYTFASELSNDFLAHTRADKTSNTTTPPANQAHNASAIYVNPTNFVSIPQTANDLQSFAEFVDNSSLVLLGSRTQNLFSNGLPRATRNTSLVNDKAAEAVVDSTPATTYLLYSSATSPVDDIDHGDDVILLNPLSGVLSSNVFDAQFAQVKPGDYITVNYGNGSVPVTFTIDSTKKFLNGSTRVYLVRINGKNLYASIDATVRIDKAFYHDSKFNALAAAAAHNAFSEIPSLIISNPSGAATLGLGFDADKLDKNHYNLYLELYPTGNPSQKSVILPAIDVTGDSGNSTGSYSLQSVVETINNKFRDPGYNARFIAFSYQGQLGIALADRYNNTSFSIISGSPDGYGAYTSTSNASFPGNVIDNYNSVDPLGFGSSNANTASPPYALSYSTPATALVSPTVIFSPLKKNFYYVDGVERDSFSLESLTTKDGYGDGYWAATLVSKQVLANRVEVSYEVPLDLCTTGLAKGKTIVIQPAVDFASSSYSSVDYGRFIISNVAFDACEDSSSKTTITVYDGVHATGISPYLSSLDIPVKLYFSDDSVSFNAEHVSDPTTSVNFKRFFEVYVDGNGDSFTHERARFNVSGSDLSVDSINGFTLYSTSEMSAINLVDVSPKLRGFNFGQYRKITLLFNSYNETTGVFDGYLCKFESPTTFTRIGSTVSGKKGETVRFYDDTNIDYVDVHIPMTQSLSSFTNKKIDIQLFPTLQLNQEKLLVATCQLQDTGKQISFITDKRQFGNVSEKQLSTSALSYIQAPQRLLDENGIVRGFDLVSSTSLTNDNKISVKGGVALIDGKLIDFNETTVNVPIVQETLAPSFTTAVSTIRWYLCVNSQSEFEFVASTDYDTSLTATYGSLTHNRLFYVKNPASTSGASYPIRSTYFAKLVTDHKDLVPLYVVSATVGLDTTWKVTSASVSDVRRFIERGFHGLTDTFTLGSKASFRTIGSVEKYISELTDYISYSSDAVNSLGQTVSVRDSIDVSGVTFGHAAPIKYVGEGGKFTVNTSFATIAKNTEFKNIPITVATDYGFKLTGSDIIFDSCDITYTYDASGDGSFTSAQMGNTAKACIFGTTSSFTGNAGKNIVIRDCKFSATYLTHFPLIGFLLAGQDHYLENILIENNKVLTTATGDDKRAVIVLSCSLTTTPTSQIGPRLVNCTVSRNTFNKNQMILMSGETNGSNKVPNVPAAVNVIIEKNICGSICYLVRQDRSYNIANTSNINDKDNMLIISKNMCRYIFCGTNKGYINVVGSSNRVINDIITATDIYSSSAIIEKNTCSWIHIGVKNPTSYAFETPMLEIDGNKINAYDSTFLTDYHSVITPNNIGLIVDSVIGT
jgi:hypothetical protein